MGLLDFPARLWLLARSIEELFSLQTKLKSAIESIDERLCGIEDRLTKIEAGHGQLIVEARAASSAAATLVAGSVLSDIVTRVTRIEIRVDDAVRRIS